MKNKKGIKIIAILIVALLFLIINKVWAYFTAYTKAAGEIEIDCANNEEPEVSARIENNKIYIKVLNKGTEAGYVRLAIYNTPNLTQIEDSLRNWENGGDGYYYYQEIVNVGGRNNRTSIKL